MEITGLLQSSVETIWSIAAELVQDGTYHTVESSGIYNPETDRVEETTLEVPIRIIETTVNAEDREASPVEVEDLKILVPFVDLEGVPLSGEDTISYGGTTKNILARKKIPGKAIHIFFLRRA